VAWKKCGARGSPKVTKAASSLARSEGHPGDCREGELFFMLHAGFEPSRSLLVFGVPTSSGVSRWLRRLMVTLGRRSSGGPRSGTGGSRCAPAVASGAPPTGANDALEPPAWASRSPPGRREVSPLAARPTSSRRGCRPSRVAPASATSPALACGELSEVHTGAEAPYERPPPKRIEDRGLSASPRPPRPPARSCRTQLRIADERRERRPASG
jgi:hypothetical protein